MRTEVPLYCVFLCEKVSGKTFILKSESGLIIFLYPFIKLQNTLLQREGFSKYNKIYEFDHNLNGSNVKMVMTSVSGHLLNYAFSGAYKKWEGCNPLDLFSAPVFKVCPGDSEPIKVVVILLSFLLILQKCKNIESMFLFSVKNSNI